MNQKMLEEAYQDTLAKVKGLELKHKITDKHKITITSVLIFEEAQSQLNKIEAQLDELYKE